MIDFLVFQEAKNIIGAVNASHSLRPLKDCWGKPERTADYLNACGCFDLAFVPSRKQLFDFQTQTHCVFSRQYLSFGVGLASGLLSEKCTDDLLTDVDSFFLDPFFQQDNKTLRAMFVHELALKVKESTNINYDLLRQVIGIKGQSFCARRPASYNEMVRDCRLVPYDEETYTFVMKLCRELQSQKEENERLYGKEKALLQFDFSLEETDQIRLVTHAYFHDDKRLPALECLRTFGAKDSSGSSFKASLLMIACLCFVQNVAKEDSFEFWSPLEKWIDCNLSTAKTQVYNGRINLVHLCHERKEINQYVMMFRSNSIVANRPASLKKICRFFDVTWKRTGMIIPENDEIKDTLRESFLTSNSAVPSETFTAYQNNWQQVTEFLSPLYEYYIQKGLASLGVCPPPCPPGNGCHVVEAIEQVWTGRKNIQHLQKSYDKRYTYHRPYVIRKEDDIYLSMSTTFEKGTLTASYGIR